MINSNKGVKYANSGDTSVSKIGMIHLIFPLATPSPFSPNKYNTSPKMFIAVDSLFN